MLRLPSFESSTALVEVEPPSIPTKPSTSSPGWNVVALNFLVRYLSLKVARSASSLASPQPPPRLDFSSSRPMVTYHSSLSQPIYWPIPSSSVLPYSTEPMAAKYCALSGVRIRSSGGTPSGSGVLRSSQILGMLAFQQQNHGLERIAARQNR